MTVIERCTGIRERLKRHNELQLAIKEAKVVRGKAEEVRALSDGLGLSLQKWRILSNNGVPVEQRPDPAPVATTIREYQDASPLPDGGAGKEYGRTKQAIGKYAKKVTDIVEKALSGLTQGAPSVDEAFLRRVEAIPKYAEKVAKIRSERQELLGGVKPTEMSPEQLQSFMGRREAFRQLLGSLKVEEFPKEVLEFFAAARRDSGAPYSKLTDAVVTWLGEQGILDRIRIKVSES